MRELNVQIRDYFEAVSEPVTVEDVFVAPVAEPPARPTGPSPVPAVRRGWLIAAGAAVLVLLVVTIPLLWNRSQDSPVLTAPSPTTTVAATTTTVPDDGSEGAVPGAATTTLPPVAAVTLALPMTDDTDLAYTILRSLDPIIGLDQIRRVEDRVFASAQVGRTSYSIELELTENPELAAAVLTELAANPPELDPDGEFPPPVEFDVPELDVWRAVTVVSQLCGRGCQDPRQSTGIAFQRGRAVAIVDGSVEEPFDNAVEQQAAVSEVALALNELIGAGLEGSLNPIQVEQAAGLESYAFSLNSANGDDRFLANATTFRGSGIVVGEDYTCSISGRFDPSIGLPPDLEQYDADYRLESRGASFTGLVFDPSSWSEYDFTLLEGVDPDYLAELGLPGTSDEWREFVIPVSPDGWFEYGLPGLPPGYQSVALDSDHPMVTVFAPTCRRYSPFGSDDGLDKAVGGQKGIPSMASGRDLLTYDLDRAAAVRAGLFSEDDPIQVIEFVVVIDAIDPWVHSVVLDIIGPDEALAPFGTYPPFTGRDGSFTIRWGFSGFNTFDDLAEVEARS